MSNNTGKGRLMSIEWLRGLAALGVCEMHIFCALDYFAPTEAFFQNFIFPISIVGRLGVPIFFVISGFILPYSMYLRRYEIGDFFNFIARRLARLEPPYIVSIALALLVLFAVTPILSDHAYELDWAGLGLHFGYLNVFVQKPWINPVYWTLAIEFQFYLLIGLLYPLLSTRLSKYGIDIFILALLGYYINTQFKGEQFITNYIHVFLIGILGYKKFIKSIENIPYYLLTALCVYFVFHFHAKAYAVSSVVTIAIILSGIDIKNKYLYRLGDVSYSLYLFHWIIGIELMRNLFVHFYPDASTMSKFLFGLLILVVCIAISFFFYEKVEKPSIRWSKQIKPRKSSDS